MIISKPTVFQFLLASAACMPAGSAVALDIVLPPETAVYQANELPGYRLVQRNCMTCHAAQYVATQPPGSPRSYWEATVKKMKKPFGAQFDDQDIPAMVDYLVKTYGSERRLGMAASPPAAVKSAPNAAAEPRTAAALLAANNCLACHAVDKRIVGPAFTEVAAKYAGIADAQASLTHNIRSGGSGKWGPVPMPAFDQITQSEAETLAKYVLSK